MSKKTVGKVATELLTKEPESRSVIEIERIMQQRYMDNLVEAVERCCKEFPEDFYIVIITKNEKLLPNVFRNQFFGRLSCPTPDYDQSVFFYNRKQEQLEYMWTIPSKDACLYLIQNVLQVHESERDLLKFVLEFSDGTLFKLSKILNGEEQHSPFLEKDN